MPTGNCRTIAMLGNHVPRQCGIATFTTDLSDALSREFSELDCFVLAMNDPGKRHAYPSRVRFEIAESDDARDSLSYKLRNILTLESRRVLCTDPYVHDPSFVPLEQVVADADVLFLATPHEPYKKLRIPQGKLLFDVWNWIPTK